MHISSIKAIWFAPTKLETKAFTLTNVDIRWTATILRWSDSINFVAKNIKVIDYLNLKTGFSFPTDWNYQGASTVGEIVIDGMHFSNELTDDVFYRIGSLIDIRSPFNITNINLISCWIIFIIDSFIIKLIYHGQILLIIFSYPISTIILSYKISPVLVIIYSFVSKYLLFKPK